MCDTEDEMFDSLGDDTDGDIEAIQPKEYRHYHIVLDVDGRIAVERITQGKFKGDVRTVQSAEAPLVFRITHGTKKNGIETRLIYVAYNDEYHPELSRLPWFHIETIELVYRGMTPRRWITENYDMLVHNMSQGIERNTVLPQLSITDIEKRIADSLLIEQLEREYQKELQKLAELKSMQEEILLQQQEIVNLKKKKEELKKLK